MNRSTCLVLAMLLLSSVLALAACSAPAAAAPAASESAPGAPQGTPMPGGMDMQNLPVTSKLAAGTLLLEDTGLKVAAGQAAGLLPLWKAVRALSSTETTTADEIRAVLDQIQESMTAEQVAAIEGMNIGPEEMAALGEKYGIRGMGGAGGPGGMPGGGEFSGMTDEQRATRVAELRASGAGRGQRVPGFGAGGMPSQQGGGAFPGGGMQPPEGFNANNTQSTPDPARAARQQSMGMNAMYLDAVIKLLEERAKQ